MRTCTFFTVTGQRIQPLRTRLVNLALDGANPFKKTLYPVMMRDLQQIDGTVAKALAGLSASRPAYWSYSDTSRSTHAFDFFQYPAMMVPAMLRDLIENIAAADKKIKTVYDPFLGSGSVLTESMMQGFDFTGTDVNPLALLIAKVKSGPFRPKLMEERIEKLQAAITADSKTRVEADFAGIDKWFSEHVIRELSVIRRAVRTESRLWCRRFFWICLAETVRLSSNSRTSTYKLHIRADEDLKARVKLSPIKLFETVLSKNLNTYSTIAAILSEQKTLKRGLYSGNISVELGDSRSTTPRALFDLMVTSPPYGDNVTTVPYGQHSYLPLQWIDLADIDSAVDSDCLSSTHTIDTRSLGGLRQHALRDTEHLRKISPHFDRCLKFLESAPRDRASRVATFTRDLSASILPIMNRLRPHAYMVWVVGNRRVGGMEIPTAQILREILEYHRAVHVTTLERVIPNKRMATKNAISSTMNKERILLFRNRSDA